MSVILCTYGVLYAESHSRLASCCFHTERVFPAHTDLLSSLILIHFLPLSAHFIIALRVDFHLDEQELLVFEKQKGVSTTARIRTERPGVGAWC